MERAQAPKQGDEGAPEAWLELREEVLPALEGIEPGARLIVITWLDRGDRSVLRVHPRDDPANPVQGVFNTRSQDRPNPIGLHPAEVLEVDRTRLRVSDLEALDGTPILDLKVALGRPEGI